MKYSSWVELFSKRWLVVALGCLIGTVVFLLTYGVQVVVPTNVDWLLTGGDLSQHYIGWEFFRQSDWTFPIGVAKDLAYPHGLAITFMDSLPIAAIPTKIVAVWLPENFQYFGLWGLFSYAALGGFAAVILRCWTKDTWIILPAVLFVCMSPIVFQRMFTHTALASHWIILFALYLTVLSRSLSARRSIVLWSVVLSLSVLIHPYFLAMNGFLLLAAVVVRFKNIRKALIEIALPVIAAVIVTWLIGGFTFTNISGQKFGEAGYDLAAPLLPNGWSVLNWPATETKGETFAYIGLGGMLLILATLVVTFIHRISIVKAVKKHRHVVIGLGVAIVLASIAAIGPTVKIAGITLLSYDLPSFIEKAWGVFRVTARLAWPLWYAVIFGCFFVLLRYSKNKRVVVAVVVLVCVVQVLDIGLSSQLSDRRDRFDSVQNEKFVSNLSDPRWQEIAVDRRHIVYLGDLYEQKFIHIAQFATEHYLTLNTGYFARKPTKDIEQTIKQARVELAAGTFEEDTIYVYDEPYAVGQQANAILLDGYSVTVR